MKKHLIFSLLGIVALVASFVACSDSPNFGEQETQNNNELILKAKAIVQSQGNTVSLPTPNKLSQHGNQSRSVSHLADLTPLWDRATTHAGGNETILIVPLQSDEEIRSRVFIKQGETTSYQFAKTFSRLIVKGDQAYVLTYMPESNYASSHSDIENELKYNPTDVNFTGMIVTSKLNGSVNWGYLYENGTLAHYVAPASKYCHDENCTEQHNHEHNVGFSVIFNLHTVNTSRSTTYEESSETDKCNFCGEAEKDCTCDFLLKQCPICLQYNDYCTCKDDDLDPEENYCEICGEYKTFCTCYDICEICKQSPCICCNCGASCTNSECNCGKTGECYCN